MSKKPRSAEWFIRETRKQYAANPGKPIRFEVDDREMKAVNAAYSKLVFNRENMVPWLKGISEPPPPPPRHIRENEPLRENVVSPKTPLRLRVVFIGPNVFTPRQVIRGTPARRYKGPEEAMGAWCARLDKLRGEFAPEHHVEGRNIVTMRPGEDRMDYEVWRGEDWLAKRYATLYPAEIARLLESGEGLKFAVKMMEPDAKLGRQWRRFRAEGSKNGGKKRALATLPEIAGHFRRYKRDNPGALYQDAEGAIAEVLGYSEKSPRSLGKLIHRRFGLPAAKWYAALRPAPPENISCTHPSHG